MWSRKNWTNEHNTFPNSKRAYGLGKETHIYTNNRSGNPKGSEDSVDEVQKQTDTMKADALKTYAGSTIALHMWIQEMDTLRNWCQRVKLEGFLLG